MIFDQIVAASVTGIVSLVGAILAYLITKSYLRNKKTSHLFWALGLWAFALSDFLEFLFALNVYSTLMMAFYLFIIVLLVQLLSIGSIELVKTRLIRNAYYAFSVVVAVLVLYSIWVGPVTNLVNDYVVSGQPSVFVILTSSLGTLPGAAAIIIVALKSWLKSKSVKMLSIIAGILIIGIAGTLYIATFPSFLYISELFGVFLIFFGFYEGKGKR
ncbi:MAG: hypothetical protein KGH49_03610 [Candidatus Micrarchaeota archaeon]|nr:hypothetical protein [Candidatus Micrarchaeota archaeon]